MPDAAERYCPRCDATRTFSRTARMVVELGVKTKWHCESCGFTVVNIESNVEAEPAP